MPSLLASMRRDREHVREAGDGIASRAFERATEKVPGLGSAKSYILGRLATLEQILETAPEQTPSAQP